jgi:Fe2+ transport system protein FeoA
MCGHVYDPTSARACAACPLHTGCTLTCCPACGYTTVDPGRSGLARWLDRIAHRRTRARGTAERAAGPQRNLVLAELRPGEEARVVAIDGPATVKRSHLQAYGVVPGRVLVVLQQRPVTVLLVDHTELAIESDLARGIWVQRSAGPTLAR